MGDYTMPAGKLVGQSACGHTVLGKDQCPIMARYLSDGTQAVLLTNLHDTSVQNLTLPFTLIGMSVSAQLSVRDVLLQKELGAHTGSYTAELHPHESALLRLSKLEFVV